LRKIDVAIGDCARLAATVSLVLAAAKIRRSTPTTATAR